MLLTLLVKYLVKCKSYLNLDAGVMKMAAEMLTCILKLHSIYCRFLQEGVQAKSIAFIQVGADSFGGSRGVSVESSENRFERSGGQFEKCADLYVDSCLANADSRSTTAEDRTFLQAVHLV